MCVCVWRETLDYDRSVSVSGVQQATDIAYLKLPYLKIPYLTLGYQYQFENGGVCLRAGPPYTHTHTHTHTVGSYLCTRVELLDFVVVVDVVVDVWLG